MADQTQLPHTQFIEAERADRDLDTISIHADDQTLLELDRVAFVSPAGSHLHGTADAESDYDIKGVFLDPLDAIILDRDRETLRASSSGGDGDRNVPGDVDVEFIELRKFVRDALAGQTYAVEMLHCPPELTLRTSPIWDHLVDHRDRLISRRVEPFVGYCRTQARKYGDKGERLAAIERVLETLEEAGRRLRIGEVADELPVDGEHVRLVDQPIRGQDEPVTLLEVVGKRYELEAQTKKAIDSLRKLRDSYGERARRARDGIDWKATSHAYRVAFELEELLATGEIVFPLERADFLRRVKRGEVDRDRVEREIPQLVERALETPSQLPNEPDVDYWNRWLVETYLADAR